MKRDISRILEVIKDELIKRDLLVRDGFIIKGLSAIQHTYDLMVKNKSTGKCVVVKYIESIDYSKVLSIAAERIDVDVDHVLLTDECPEDVKNLLTKLRVHVVKLNPSGKVEEIVTLIEKLVKE